MNYQRFENSMAMQWGNIFNYYRYLSDALFDWISRSDSEDESTIRGLLLLGTDIEYKDSRGLTPLLYACSLRRERTVALLIKCGAYTKDSDDELNTALHHAAMYGWENVVLSLLKKSCNPNTRNNRGETALIVASSKGHLEIVKLLVESGADLNVRNDDHFTALHKSAAGGHLEVVKYLVEQGADPNVRDLDDWTPIHSSAERGHLEVVRYLVEQGADINSSDTEGHTALLIASLWGYEELVRYLVEMGSHINPRSVEGYTPLLNAAADCNRNLVDFLMHSGANLDVASKRTKCTMLHYASARGWMDIVQTLVKRGCDLEARSKYGLTALGMACNERRLDVARCLLHAGARSDTVENNWRSLLHYFTVDGEAEIEWIELLVANGAYFKPVHYKGLKKSSSLEVLQDATLCCRSITNKFNNHDLPELYEILEAGSLPSIENMKIVSGTEVARAIERTVEFEIRTKNHCNILKVRPIALSVFCIRSLLQYHDTKMKSKKGSKRPGKFQYKRSRKLLCPS